MCWLVLFACVCTSCVVVTTQVEEEIFVEHNCFLGETTSASNLFNIHLKEVEASTSSSKVGASHMCCTVLASCCFIIIVNEDDGIMFLRHRRSIVIMFFIIYTIIILFLDNNNKLIPFSSPLLIHSNFFPFIILNNK